MGWAGGVEGVVVWWCGVCGRGWVDVVGVGGACCVVFVGLAWVGRYRGWIRWIGENAATETRAVRGNWCGEVWFR